MVIRFQTPRKVPGSNMKVRPVQMYSVSKRESVVSREAEMLKISIGVSGRPACLSILVARVDMQPHSVSFFHRDRSREQYVVLKMNVLVKIGFESTQGFVQRLIANAGISRRHKIDAGFAYGA